MKKIKILIADDHKILREGLIGCLLSKQDFKVVGEAIDGIEVIEMASKLRPDVVLMDISMPKINGFQATKKILEKYPNIKIIVLSAHDDEEYVEEFIRCGAKGYILKNNSSVEIINAIEKVLDGNVYIDNVITQTMFNKVVNKDEKKTLAKHAVLTNREIEVLALVADGRLNKEIADYLNISIKTVIAHRENIKEKLGLHSVAKLTRYAIEMGYVEMIKN